MSSQALMDLVERWASYEAGQEVEATISRPLPAGVVPPISIGPLGFIGGARILLERIRQTEGPSSGNDWLALAKVRQEARLFHPDEFDSEADLEEFRTTVSAVDELYRWARSRNPKKMGEAELFLALTDHVWDLRVVIVLIRKNALQVGLTDLEARRLDGLGPDTAILGTTLFEWEELMRPPMVESRSHEPEHASLVLRRVGSRILDTGSGHDEVLSVRTWSEVLQICRKMEDQLFEALSTYGFALGLAGVVPSESSKKTAPMPLLFKGKAATLKAARKTPPPSA